MLLIRYYIRQNSLTTRQLAESVGVVHTTVLMYERGQFPIPYQIAVAMVEVLEIDRNQLLDEFTKFMDYPHAFYIQNDQQLIVSYMLHQAFQLIADYLNRNHLGVLTFSIHNIFYA